MSRHEFVEFFGGLGHLSCVRLEVSERDSTNASNDDIFTNVRRPIRSTWISDPDPTSAHMVVNPTPSKFAAVLTETANGLSDPLPEPWSNSFVNARSFSLAHGARVQERV